MAPLMFERLSGGSTEVAGTANGLKVDIALRIDSPELVDRPCQPRLVGDERLGTIQCGHVARRILPACLPALAYRSITEAGDIEVTSLPRWHKLVRMGEWNAGRAQAVAG